MEADKDLRPLVAMVFLPGLYICLLLSAVLSVCIAGLLITILYWLFSFIHRIPVVIMALVAVGGLLGVIYSIKGGWNTIQEAVVHCHAVKITKDQAPKLFNMIKDLSSKMKTAMPNNILLELGSNFFVTESKVQAFEGEFKSRILCLSAPMLHILSPLELKAIIAHELAHFTGEDIVYSRRFYPIYRGTSSALFGMASVSTSGSDNNFWMSLSLIIPMLVLRIYLELFARIESGIGRKREFRADKFGALLVTSKVTASALVKAHVYGTLWNQISEKWIIDALNEGKAFRNISELFASTYLSEKSLLREVAQNLSMHLSHPIDSHPSLKERLLAIGENPTGELATEGETSVSLFNDLSSLEEILTEFETSLIAQYHPNVDRTKLNK
jgi:Zn-dependent protease with chaperone function